jgi:flagellar protein FliS
MLFRGARDRINQARGYIEHGDYEGKTRAINACIDIIDGLQASLDHERGGDIAENLDSLYEYMQRRLFRANADNDQAALAEVGDLVSTLQSAWTTIGSAD